MEDNSSQNEQQQQQTEQKQEQEQQAQPQEQQQQQQQENASIGTGADDNKAMEEDELVYEGDFGEDRLGSDLDEESSHPKKGDDIQSQPDQKAEEGGYQAKTAGSEEAKIDGGAKAANNRRTGQPARRGRSGGRGGRGRGGFPMGFPPGIPPFGYPGVPGLIPPIPGAPMGDPRIPTHPITGLPLFPTSQKESSWEAGLRDIQRLRKGKPKATTTESDKQEVVTGDKEKKEGAKPVHQPAVPPMFRGGPMPIVPPHPIIGAAPMRGGPPFVPTPYEGRGGRAPYSGPYVDWDAAAGGEQELQLQRIARQQQLQREKSREGGILEGRERPDDRDRDYYSRRSPPPYADYERRSRDDEYRYARRSPPPYADRGRGIPPPPHPRDDYYYRGGAGGGRPDYDDRLPYDSRYDSRYDRPPPPHPHHDYPPMPPRRRRTPSPTTTDRYYGRPPSPSYMDRDRYYRDTRPPRDDDYSRDRRRAPPSPPRRGGALDRDRYSYGDQDRDSRYASRKGDRYGGRDERSPSASPPPRRDSAKAGSSSRGGGGKDENIKKREWKEEESANDNDNDKKAAPPSKLDDNDLEGETSAEAAAAEGDDLESELQSIQEKLMAIKKRKLMEELRAIESKIQDITKE